MPRYKVSVTSDSAVAVAQSLHDAAIPTIGPAMAKFVEGSDDWSIGDHVTAVLEAADPDNAVRRVREITGSDGEVVGSAEPWGTT